MTRADTTRAAHGLSIESLGYLNYLLGVLVQPIDSWDGFYAPRSPQMNFALRYQLAFATYALAAMAARTPAYRTPYAAGIRAAIERMLNVASWGYWREASSEISLGHMAVLAAPHAAAVDGTPSDPIVRDNLQYSGHLSTMIGLYEKVSGDHQYDRPFPVRDQASGAEYIYTHTEVAARIHAQMVENSFGGVCCERGMAYVPCNNYALASNTLHDALHGSNFSAANSKWLRTLRGKMLLRGPAARGVFGTALVKDLHLATPVAFNFTDAWGLAFLTPFDRPLVRRLYPKFRKKVVMREDGSALVGSSQWSERAEISDEALNTGFGYVLARQMRDVALAAKFERFARQGCGAGWNGAQFALYGAARTLQASALFALGSALTPGGNDLASLFTAPPRRPVQPEPSLVSLETEDAGVERAEYSEGVIEVALRRLGAVTGKGRDLQPVTLLFQDVHDGAEVEIDGEIAAPENVMRTSGGELRVLLKQNPAGVTVCRVVATV